MYRVHSKLEYRLLNHGGSPFQNMITEIGKTENLKQYKAMKNKQKQHKKIESIDKNIKE